MEETVLAFRLDVLCEEGRVLTVEADGSWSIDNVKAKIQDLEGTLPSQQMLYFEGLLLTYGNCCLYDLRPYWDESLSMVILEMEMEIMWLPSTTKERDEARSRWISRSPIQFSSSSVQLSSSPVPSFVEKK